MKIAVLGSDGPLASATRSLLAEKKQLSEEPTADTIIYLPGALEELENLVSRGGFRRLVLRSHAFAYGSSIKNPGEMTEDFRSRLPARAPEQRWIRAEKIAGRMPSWAAVRLTNVLSPGEGDPLVQRLGRRVATSLAGYDPNVQFISLSDAARALVAAAESDATGVFNAAGPGAIPLKQAFRAAGTWRVPVPPPLAKMLQRDSSANQLQFNWTVSGGRAKSELGFTPRDTTVHALDEFLQSKPGGRPERLQESYDPWGLDADYIAAWDAWFQFVRKFYWRVEHEGIENIPAAGRGLFISNHRGFIPIDAVVHLFQIRQHRNRILRFLIIPSLLNMPHMCSFLTKLGGVVANQQNAARLLQSENLVGLLPEGIRGTFTPYRDAYKLRDFGKSAFAKIAIENQAPIIPAAVVGHAEIFPIVGRINSSYMKRVHGWPYFPIAPPFPLAPIPIPSKWHIRVLEPIPVTGLDSGNKVLVREFSRYVQEILQRNIDEMVRRRKWVFWGRILDGTHPPRPEFSDRVETGVETGTDS